MCNIAGIDIASRKFDYRIIDGNGASLSRGSYEMNLYGFSSFLRTVPADTVFIMESTGRYHKNLCHFLIGKGFSVCVENPMMIKNYVKSTTLRKTKTDRVDAAGAAQRARGYLPQLEAYAWALSRVTGKAVRRRIVYFLSCGAAVEL